ncbi:hypothetical protein CANCADRAFT_17936, partial [Tortispora caseinolytica NRRL Y-17796]
FAIFPFIFTVFAVFILIQRFISIKTTPLYIFIPIFLAIYIPSSIIILLPIDLSCQSSHTIFCISNKIILALWRMLYWLQFALTWLILPILQGYIESGQDLPSRKLADSLRYNAKFQLAMLTAGIVGIVYLTISAGLSLASVKALAIALSHCYTLIGAIWLLGHGLVNVPRMVLVKSFHEHYLNRLYKSAPRAHDAFMDAESDLTDICSEVLALAPVKAGAFEDWIDSLLAMIPATASSRNFRSPDPASISSKYLASLSNRLHAVHRRRIRTEAEWNQLVHSAIKTQELVNSRSTRSLVFSESKNLFNPRMSYIIYTLISPWLSRLVGFALIFLSSVLVSSEVTHGTRLNLIGLTVSHTSGLGQQILSSAILLYVCLTAFYSLSKVRVTQLYSIVKGHTDYSSAIFYSMYLCRLTIPLSYNYLTLQLDRSSMFEEFLGKSINLSVISESINDWLPRFILIPVILTGFNIYDKLSKILAYDINFDDDETSGTEDFNVAEGRDLITREIQL